MASVLRIITPGEISVLVDWLLSQGEGHKLSAGPLARRWCNTPKTFVYICIKHLTLIKGLLTPRDFCITSQCIKTDPEKIKNWISSSKDWSPHVVFSLTFWLNLHLKRGGSSSLLIMSGLLRSDRGGLSVSSPSGEWEDACSLRRWRTFFALEFY